MPIRVLHIIASLRLGGAQICLKNIVEHASKDKIEHFIYPLRSKQIDISIEGSIIKFPYPNYDPRKFFAILRICKQYNIDIIHAHLEKPVAAALLSTFFHKIPVIVHEHGSIVLPGLNNIAYRCVLKCLKKRAAHYIAVSKANAADLERIAGISHDSVSVIHNAVDFDVFKPEDQNRAKIRNDLKIPSDQVILGFVGRLNKAKGPDILIRALKLLSRKSDNYRLIFVGDGPERKALTQLAQTLGVNHAVNFLGFRDDVPKLMAAFDIGLIPSRNEAFGITAVEFMRMKIPIVTSAVDGLKEIVENKKNCLVTEQNTPEQICSCVNRLMEDSDLRSNLVEHAFHDSDRFSIKKQLFDIEVLYEKIISQENKAAVDLSK